MRRRTEEELSQKNKELEETNLKLKEVTEQLIRSANLIQSEKMRAVGTMTAGVAHELNNPMMSILNFIQYCLRHTLKDDKRYHVLEDAKAEVNRCIGIIENLLTFARMEKEGEEALGEESCSIIFDRVFKLLSYRIEAEQVTIKYHLDPAAPRIKMRVNHIQQVFFNLILNALDAVEESQKKEIQVKVEPEGQYLKISITDTGCGIAPEILPNIFDPFFTTKGNEGTGLGLPISYKIIEAHQGKITCQSKPDQGTSFIILLPI